MQWGRASHYKVSSRRKLFKEASAAAHTIEMHLWPQTTGDAKKPDGDKIARGIDLVWAGITEKLGIPVISLKVNWIDCKFDFSSHYTKQKNLDLCFLFRSSACLMSICLNYRKSGTFLVWRPAHVDNWIGRKYVLHCSCQPNSCCETTCFV